MSEKDRLLLDPDTGVLQHQGWQVNGHDHIIDNSDTASQALFAKPRRHLNKIKKRGLNGFFLKTNDHFIELFFPVELGLTCVNKITIFELDKGPKSKKVHEIPTCIYPTIKENGDITWKSDDHVGTVFNYGPYGSG